MSRLASMEAPRCLAGRLVRRLGDQEGVALPVAVAMLALVMLLGAVAVQHAVSASDGASRDSRVKAALQAADAGAESALGRMNTFANLVNDPLSGVPCVVSSVQADGSLGVARYSVDANTGWCPASAHEDLGNGESYQYTVSGINANADINSDGLDATLDRKIVSTGTVGDVTRRVVVRASALDPSRLFGEYAAFSSEDLVLENQGDVGSPEVTGSARSNGSIHLNHPNATVSGDATPGPEGEVIYSKREQVGGEVDPAFEPLDLPPVEMPETADVDGEVCSVSLLVTYTCPSSTYDTATRRLSLSGETVVLRGNTFSFCSITMTNNSTLRFEATDLAAPVRVYIDSPDNCLDSSGNEPPHSMSFSNKPTIEWALDLLGLAGVQDLTYPNVQFYVVGDDPPTSIFYENNNTGHTAPMEIYAPHSDVTLAQNAQIQGGVISNRLTMKNRSAVIPSEPGLLGHLSGVTPIYDRGLYQECASSPPTADEPPDAGC